MLETSGIGSKVICVFEDTISKVGLLGVVKIGSMIESIVEVFKFVIKYVTMTSKASF